MADKTLFGRLRKLFSSGVIIRRAGKNLRVVDTQRLQSSGNLETNRLVDRYNRLHSPSNSFSTSITISTASKLSAPNSSTMCDVSSILDSSTPNLLESNSIILVFIFSRQTVVKFFFI